jgi:hypothetical protein
MKGGLSSGEGLINEVRDENKKWDPKEQQYAVTDPGVADKRLMVTEPEFANALAVMERPGNTNRQTLGSRPRSIRLSMSACTTAVFSVAPSTRPSGS